jgi:hypothetical protein
VAEDFLGRRPARIDGEKRRLLGWTGHEIDAGDFAVWSEMVERDITGWDR